MTASGHNSRCQVVIKCTIILYLYSREQVSRIHLSNLNNVQRANAAMQRLNYSLFQHQSISTPAIVTLVQPYIALVSPVGGELEMKCGRMKVSLTVGLLL